MAGEVIDLLLRARMEASGVEAGVGQIQKSLKGLTLPKGVTAELEKSFGKLTPLLKEYQKQLNKGFSNKKDLQNFNALKDKINETFGEIRSQVQFVNSQDVRLKVDTQEIDKLENKITAKSADLQKALDNVFTKSVNSSNITDQLNKVIGNTGKASTIKPMADMAKQLFNTQDYAAYNNKIDELRNKILSLKTTKIDLATALGVKDAEHNLDAVDKKIETFFNNLKVNEGKVQTIEHLKQELKDLGINLENVKLESLGRGAGELKDIDSLISQLSGSLRETGEAASEAGSGMIRMVDEVNQLKTSTQYFFSLRNMLNLFKRGVREAYEAVKELDAAMTETAVVTDFSVGDMWKKLPEYTANANALGASVKDMYKATTLYYQQGLETDAAMGIANETMKMARIGGLEAADATDKMTAALRGFNMEINETSAQRVNDVYSNLAAKTASNTEELGTAMQRTASIAASAGMSFEGTAAFLAQAIETTREPAENLGTAMKTIVARFTELKKNPLEIAEVDGEEVDYNKVDTALKSIGVSLKDANGQFRNLDQVFLDIAQRWDGLTQTQQRYVATQAAGSRQQSRFIAMMSNYDRTVQLMDYANNSAGASNEQFGKTMESLEAKLNKLKNAWQQFEMGIANNSFIKTAVDGLTGFLNITNKIIDKLSLGSGAIKSFLSIFAAFTGLKIAGRGANALIGGLGGLVDPRSSVKEGLRTGLFGQGKNAAQAKAITVPIVNSLNKISQQIAQIKNQNNNKQSNSDTRNTSKQEYLDVKKQFEQLSGKEGFKISDASKLFGELDTNHQLSMFNNNPGTKQAMKKASLDWFGGLGLSKELKKEGKSYISSIYKGMEEGKIPVDKGIELIGRPDLWGEHFATDTAKAISTYFQANSEKAGRAAQAGAWRQLGMKGASDEAKKAFLVDKKNLDQYNKLVTKNYNKAMQGMSGYQTAKGTVTDMGRFANDIGAVADRFTQAGYGISAFGSLLSQLGGPIGTVGAGIQNLGGIVSSVGMSISGATGLITMFTEGVEIAGTGITIMGSTIAAVVGPIAALGAALFIAHQHFKKIKEAGEEVTNTFKESSKSVEDNIAKLKSYQSEFATLSKGVDSNGNNVNLDDSQYQRYLEIVDDITAINPEIVQGYNAQGHAIIDNNKALTETLKKQEEIKNSVLDTYTNEESLQKLINARNINKDYKNIQTQENGVSMGYGHGNEGRNASNGIGKSVPLAGDVSSIADKLRLLTGTDALGNTIKVDDAMLQKYGIESMDALISGEEQAVKKFIKHRDQIQTDLANSGLKLNEGILKGFEKLGENADAFDAAIQPIYDNLLANVSNSKVFESIAPEFRDALNIGLKDLASQDLSASEMSKAANNMAARFANLTTGSGKYKDALDIVEKAQQDFAASLNETEYKAEVQPAIDDLTRLKEEALKEGSAYGDALAEYLENQIEQISRFTEEGTISLSEALNTMQDDIAAAEGALSSFQDATKSDYSTAASGMKGIFEEIFKETDGKQLHTEGFGDQTFWKGAKELLSQDVVDTGNIDNVIDKLNRIKPALEDGQDGWENFLDIVENTKGMDKWFKFFDDGTYDINIPEEEFSEVAKQLGVSENFLTSMLNKGRQFANISFSNVDSVRQALATSNSAIKGQSVDANGNKSLYVKEDSIRTELFNQGYVTKDDQDRQLAAYFEKGIKIIPAADSKELTKDDWKNLATDWGIKNLPDLIQTLNDTGEFTKDEIKAYAEKMDMLGTEGGFEQDYADIISAAENPELVRQTSELQSIDAKVGALLDKRSSSEQTSDWKDFHKMIGDEGDNTDFQRFARGENSSGKSLDSGEYETTKKNMEAAIQTAEEASQKYKIMAEQSSGADKKHFEELAQKYADDEQHIKDLLSAGEKAYTDSQNQIEKERQAAQEQQVQQQARQNQAQKNVQAANEKGKTQTNTIVNNTEENKTVHETTVYDAQVDPELETLDAKYGQDRTTQAIVNYLTKGEEDLQLADDKISNIDLATQDPKQVMITANTNGVSVAEAALKSLPSTKTIGINLNTGSFTAKIAGVLSKLSAVAAKAREAKLGGTAAGHNNSFKTISVPTFQSAAKGKGHVGPKNRGGLTLTGEEGYEIAWLPSEGTSMILGATGPQMINLPADAVVYTHEQSEDILKKKQTIDAGSHAGDASGSGKRRTSNNSGSGSGSGKGKGKKNKNKKKKKKDKTKADINNFSIEEVVQFNIDQELTRLTDQIARRTKDIEKALGKIGTTYSDIVGSTQAQLTALQGVKDQNQALYDSYSRQLADYRSQQTYISYTNSKGDSKQQKINIWDYLNADGSANTAAIAAAGGREVQEAIFKVINSAKGMVDGMNNAKKAIDDANDQIDEFHKKIADTFYNWENQITWVYDLTQRLNNIQSLRDRFSEHINLELDKVSAGFSTVADALNEVTAAAKRDNRALLDQIAAQREMINARKAEMEDAYSWADEQKELSYQISKNADKGIINQAETNLEAAKAMRNYIKSFQQREDGSIAYEIDWAKFEQDKRDVKITNTTYDAIYKQLEKLNSSTTEYNNSIKDLTSSVDQFYQDIIEAQQTQVDLEADLLEGLEKQGQERIDNLKDLNSSLEEALKDLLDEVKRKLDERRRQEDNAKTERDISQKQQRLAALRADTSGGHQVEIAQLEKEIAESQQSYQRSLEDQLLDKLQQQGDEAARQRERQIELLETSNKIGIDNRAMVREWVENPTKYQTEIINILKKQAGYEEAGFLKQEQIAKDTQKRLIEAQNAANQLGVTSDTSQARQNLVAEQEHQQQLEQEKINTDKQLVDAQTKLAQATATKTAKQNELNNVNSSIASTQSEIDKYKNSFEYRQYQKLQAAYEQYQQAYNNKQQQINKSRSLNSRIGVSYEPKLSLEQFARQRGYDRHIGFSKYKYDYNQITKLESQLNDLQKQKTNLTNQTTAAEKVLSEAQKSVNELQAESNDWANQIVQSQQIQQDLQGQITNTMTESLIGVRDTVDNQLNIESDVSYLNTNGKVITGTEKLTPEIKAEQDYTIAKEEQAKRNAAEEAARQAAAAAAAEAERQRQAEAARQAAVNAYNTELQRLQGKSGITLAEIEGLKALANPLGLTAATYLQQLANGKPTWKQILSALKGHWNADRLASTFSSDNFVSAFNDVYGKGEYKKHKGKGTPYKTGGLADYTGPAWLDGTPSKPELVLNPTDTKNFLALRDVLSSAMKSTGSVNNSYGGDATYEININVDKLTSDYDVDRVAERVKKIIVKDSSYRNVTQVRNLR